MTPANSFYRPVHQGTLIVLMTVLIVGALAAIYSVRLIFLGTLVGVGLGTLIAPLAIRARDSFRVPRAVTSLLILFLLYGSFLILGYFLFSMLSDQIVPVVKKLPDYFNGTQGGIQGRLNELGSQLGLAKENVDFQKYLTGAAGAVVEGIRFGASALAGAVFIFFVALYLSIRPREYLDGVISAFPSHRRARIRSVVHDCVQSLRHWAWAQLTAMSVVGICAAIALKIVGSPYWAFFGALTFVLELIPYFGPLTALTAVCLVTAAADPSSLLKTAIAFFVVLALEGNVIIPLIMRGSVKLPPVYLLILISVMGEWFGFFGFLMAAPTLAVMRTAYLRAYLPLMNSRRVHPSKIPTVVPQTHRERSHRPNRSATQL